MRNICIRLAILILAIQSGVTMARQPTDAKILAAWLIDLNTIKVVISSNVNLNTSELKVLSHDGESLRTYEIVKEKRQVMLKFNEVLSLEKNYQISYLEKKIWVKPTLNLLNTYFSSNDFLGSRIDGKILKVSVWSPTATAVNLLLFDKDAKTILGKVPLQRGKNGVWIGLFNDDLFKIQNFEGLYYQYEVTAYGETHLALDPYAKSMAAFDPVSADHIGKAAIINPDSTCPNRLSKNLVANPTDFIAYEAHMRDFSIDPNLDITNELKGSYKGFTKIIPHLKDLGITHVQFMPLQNFYTVNEINRKFQGTDINSKLVNYNWGYDPQNYFTPDGWYSLNPNDPYLRIKEVKELFGELHHNGIGVILDVVYNHLYSEDILENIAPGCYLRKNDQGEISHGTGAGATLESRNLMARRLIIDSLKYWQNFYGVDGFRFDLMGFIDQDTMNEIRATLGPDAILYGEAWNFTDLPYNEATTKTNFPHQANLSVFNDSSRDSYAGRNEGKGFAQGVFTEASRVKTGIIGGLKNFPDPNGEILNGDYHRFAEEPFETLNYLSIHDGYTLWDKINLSYGENRNERERIVRLALGMLFTSQGRIVLHGGDEIGRSKPLAKNDPNPDRAHTSVNVDPENGISFFHENSYASPDITNMVDWKRGVEFNELKKYLKGLIELRRVTPSLRYNSADSIRKGLRFLDTHKIKTKSRSFIAFIIDNTLENSIAVGFKKNNYKKILVVQNADQSEIKFNVPDISEAKKWDILVDDQTAGILPIKNSRVVISNGEITIPRKCTVVLGGME